MLLNVYLGTTAASWTIVFLYDSALKKKITRDGYKFVDEDKSMEELLIGALGSVAILSCPVLNIILGGYILFNSEKLLKSRELSLLEEGKIYKPNDETTNIQPEMESYTVEDESEYTDQDQDSIEGRKSDMPLLDALAYLEEMKKISSQQGDTISEISSENVGDQGPVLKKTLYPNKRKLIVFKKKFYG